MLYHGVRDRRALGKLDRLAHKFRRPAVHGAFVRCALVRGITSCLRVPLTEWRGSDTRELLDVQGVPAPIILVNVARTL